MTGLSDAALAKLASSGVSQEIAQRCGLYSVESAHSEVHTEFEQRPALIIPYFDIQGQQIFFEREDGFHPFHRVRYLGEPPVSFSPREPLRYQQMKQSGTFAYLCPLINWTSVSQAPAIALAIVEGELKAIKACAEGLPTIGLAGVDCFRRRIES
jgi:putative DNA primase/helicase